MEHHDRSELLGDSNGLFHVSIVTDSWVMLYNQATIQLGEARLASVNGITGRAIVGEMNADEIFAAGGLAESGGFKLQMLASDFSIQPQKFSPATARGVTLQVLNANDNDGILYLEIGDPVANEGP